MLDEDWREAPWSASDDVGALFNWASGDVVSALQSGYAAKKRRDPKITPQSVYRRLFLVRSNRNESDFFNDFLSVFRQVNGYELIQCAA